WHYWPYRLRVHQPGQGLDGIRWAHGREYRALSNAAKPYVGAPPAVHIGAGGQGLFALERVRRANARTDTRRATLPRVARTDVAYPSENAGKWRNGRRARFRSVCPKGREGSTPSFPTITEKHQHRISSQPCRRASGVGAVL